MDSAVRADNEKWIYDHFLPISEQGSALIDGLNDDLKIASSTVENAKWFSRRSSCPFFMRDF
jgi:hypothetical protein